MKTRFAFAVFLATAWLSRAQSTAPAPLPTPAMTGPLQAAPPTVVNGGPFGSLDVNGVVSGMGLWQGNYVSGDGATQAALTNGQIFLQKTTGWWQFYVQAGAYDLPALGTPFTSTNDTVSNLFGPVPVAFLKIVPTKNVSILIGALPTVIGPEYLFSFENMNVTRGLLWNQENAVNRGIQINDSIGKLTASFSWNDGFYSNRYTWLTGSLSYAFSAAHSLSFAAGGNYAQTAYQTAATPVQNNSSIYEIAYTYAKGPWIVQPYFQDTEVPTNGKAGIAKGAATRSGAVLVNYGFPHHVSLAGRFEYLATTGSADEGSVNLLFGPGSAAWSLTVTPTYQYGRFFVRGDIALLRATSYTVGYAFGTGGANRNQLRGVIEAGFLF
jgi:hypothetical protein